MCLVKREVRSIILLSKDGPNGMGLLILYLNVNLISKRNVDLLNNNSNNNSNNNNNNNNNNF